MWVEDQSTPVVEDGPDEVYETWGQLVQAMQRDKTPEQWAKEIEAAAPSFPHLTDEWQPTNQSLWQTVLDVAKGDKRDFTLGDRTINSPNNGQGFYPWPHPNGLAWAVKQYNGFGGKWKRQEASKTAAQELDGEIIPDPLPIGDYQFRSVRDLVHGRPPEPEDPPPKDRLPDLVDQETEEEVAKHVDETWQDPPETKTAAKLGLTAFQWNALGKMRLGTVTTTYPGAPGHEELLRLQALGFAQLGGTSQYRQAHYWDITRKGAMVVVAGLGEDLERKMQSLLQGQYDPSEASKIGQWFEDNFRIRSPRTPRGQKALKERAQLLAWALKHGGASRQNQVASDWAEIRKQLPDLVQHFTDEGGKTVPKELRLGGRVYINETGVDEAKLKQYAARLETIFKDISGWRAKALQGTLKVVLASPRNFRGTASGTYKSGEDALYVRTTPNILKRSGGGYASFEYIIVHELGHRYEWKASLPSDFDKPMWLTTRYSRKEGEAFAELFALGHFNLTGSWDRKVIDRFERVMSGGPEFVPASV